MGASAFEREILAEIRKMPGKKKFLLRDMLEWSTGEVTPQDGEQVIRLPSLGVTVAIADDYDPMADKVLIPTPF